MKFEPKNTSNIQFTFEVWEKSKSGRGNKPRRKGNKNKINRKKLSKSMPKGAKGSKDTSKGKLRKKTLHKGRRQTRSMKKERLTKKNKKKGKRGKKNLMNQKQQMKKREKKNTHKNLQARKTQQSVNIRAAHGNLLCPQDGWVMIVEGGQKRSNPYIIMNKTCLSDIPEPSQASSTVTAFSDQAQVYYRRGSGSWQFKISIKPSTPSTPSECLEDCEWKENPYFHGTSFWRIGGWNVPNPCSFGDNGDPQGCVRLQFSMALVPKELSCLDDCFSNVPKDTFLKKCRDTIPSAIKAADRLRTGVDLSSLVGQSDDKDIDCILFNRMLDSTPRDLTYDVVSLSLIPELGQRRKRSFIARQTTTTTTNTTTTTTTLKQHYFSNFLPTTPSDLALMFCIMANLDARSKLNITHGFHVISKIWDDKTCSSFLPKLNYEESFEIEPSTGTPRGSQRSAPSKTRVSGPASATIKR